MKSYDKLEIHFDPSVDTFNKLTTILGVQPSDDFADFPNKIPSCWTYEVVDDKPDEYFDFINIFLDILETKYADLEKLNIKRDDITVWMLYEYDQQCNMEFDPARLKRLGDNGIKLCISCWDSGKEYGNENG
ncbi:MAG: hypothetical protein KF900_12765 [Bacteroidetes bacterium]|nr:hypothetical protein [Bacteroidota bacterium]